MSVFVCSQRYRSHVLTLSGGGRDASPLPVCEILSNGQFFASSILADAVSVETAKVQQRQNTGSGN